jgi:ubiquinone/menaquinone biosynthesis C-methylase UbiE
MLSIGKERDASLELQNIVQFREGGAETIDLPSSSFDAVLSRWGLMFLPNPPAALTNIQKTFIDYLKNATTKTFQLI